MQEGFSKPAPFAPAESDFPIREDILQPFELVRIFIDRARPLDRLALAASDNITGDQI
jgi:hypothetical protein